MPSKGAFAAYSLALLGGTVGAVVALVPAIARFVGGVAGIPQVAVSVGGGAFAVLVGVVGPVLAYQWTTKQFESFVVD